MKTPKQDCCSGRSVSVREKAVAKMFGDNRKRSAKILFLLKIAKIRFLHSLKRENQQAENTIMTI